MFGERWQRILDAQGGDTALLHPGGALTFQELEKQALALEADTCPVLGRFFLAQGGGVEIARALLAGLLRGLPVQVVEQDRSRRVPASPAPPGTALVKQTVGASGLRRCQFFSQAQILADAGRLHAALGLAECGVALAPLSVAHSFGLTTTLLPMLLHGLPVHWLPTPFPATLTEALAASERAFLPGVPAMWKAWLLAGLDLSRARLAVSAGSPLTLELEEKVRRHSGLKLHNLYGTSETGAISYDDTAAPRQSAACLGRLLPGVRATPGVDGRLLVESDAAGLGYDSPLPGELFTSGRHLTWDVASLEGGTLFFEKCTGPGINVASRKLSPEDIAAKLRSATGLARVRVYGQSSRDPERVQDVVAEVGLPAGGITQEFKSRACVNLAPWEVPRHWKSLSDEELF